MQRQDLLTHVEIWHNDKIENCAFILKGVQYKPFYSYTFNWFLWRLNSFCLHFFWFFTWWWCSWRRFSRQIWTCASFLYLSFNNLSFVGNTNFFFRERNQRAVAISWWHHKDTPIRRPKIREQVNALQTNACKGTALYWQYLIWMYEDAISMHLKTAKCVIKLLKFLQSRNYKVYLYLIFSY